MAEETTGESEMEDMELGEENIDRLISNDEEESVESEQLDTHDGDREQREADCQEDMQLLSDGPHHEQCDSQPDDEVEDHEENLDTTSDAVAPRLFISGLDNKTTDADFRAHFAKYGKLTECSIPRKRRANADKSRGFGFVTMATVADMETVLKDTHVINDKAVKVAISRPPYAPEKLCLRVRNLDIDKTTEKTLAAHFGRFGEVADCSVARKTVDGQAVSRGLGYVTMTTEEEVRAALGGCVDGHQTVDGKLVDVKRVASSTKSQDRLRQLWFGGLDRDKTTESDVADYFGAFGTVAECVVVRNPPSTDGGECKSKGYGFINMSSVAETSGILKHKGPHKIHGKELIFNRVPLLPSQNDYDRPLIKELYISGLKDVALTADDLRAYFNTHANVRNVTMIKDEGAARVLLGSVHDAEKLAHMKDHRLNKVWLTVRLADPQSPPKAIKAKKQDQKQVSNRKGFGSSRGRGPYHNQPMPGGHVSARQAWMGNYYYDEDPSGYGPVRGRGPTHSLPRGHVQGPGHLQGRVFTGRGRSSVLRMGVGYGDAERPGASFGDSYGLGGGYDDDWGEGGNMTRGKGRNMTRGKGRSQGPGWVVGRGRGWRPY